MAITKYSELLTAISDRLAREDMSASATVTAECVNLCEAEMQRRLRTTDMETQSLTFPVSAEFVAVPADMLQVRNFYLDSVSPRRQLRHLTPEMQTARYPQASTGVPDFYSIVGKQFRFAPIPDGSYTGVLVYFAKIPPLQTYITNWVCTDHPDAYLYGSLAQAAIRQQDVQGYTYYKQFFDQALAQIQSSADKMRWTGPGLATVPG